MEMKAQVMILLVVCIAAAAAERYCPEVKGKCSLSYSINDCCSQSDCPSYAMCCKGRCGYVCKNPSDTPTKGYAIKPGDECKIGQVYPKTGFEWLFGSKSK